MSKYYILLLFSFLSFHNGISQNVGIDVSEPSGKLHVKSNGNFFLPQLRLTQEGYDFTRIKLENDVSDSFWDIAARASNTPADAQMNIFFNSPTQSADWLTLRGSGQIGINNTNPQAKLDIKYIGEDQKLLQFTTDRPWWFKQTGSGVETKLTLQPEFGYKNFEIVSPNGNNRAAVFRVADAISNVYLAPDIGNVSIGNTNPQAKLDVSGKIKVGNDTSTPSAGTIRWNEETEDFEGYNGTKWLSLTKDKASNSWPVNMGEGTACLTDFVELEVSGDAITMNNSYTAVGNSNIKSVKIFKFENGTWASSQILSPSDPSTSGNFGKSVAISGNWLIVGASGGVVSGTAKGKIYVFKLVGGLWVEHQILSDAEGQVNEGFGNSVAIYGTDLIAGSPNAEVNSVPAAGKMSFFKLSNDQWIDNGEYANASPVAGAAFGYNLAIYGNYIAVAIPNIVCNDDPEIEIMERFLSSNAWVRPGLYLQNIFNCISTMKLDMSSNKLAVSTLDETYIYGLTGNTWAVTYIGYDNSSDSGVAQNYAIIGNMEAESSEAIPSTGFFEIRDTQNPYTLLKRQFNHNTTTTGFGQHCTINDNDWVALIHGLKICFAKIITN